MDYYAKLSVHNISIHAPREGGDRRFLVLEQGTGVISIHAPREGGDFSMSIKTFSDMTISIHAPREGGDGCRWCRRPG